jgi:DNA-binding NtrC family response regulator
VFRYIPCPEVSQGSGAKIRYTDLVRSFFAHATENKYGEVSMTPIQRPRVVFVDDEQDLADSLAAKYSNDYETEAYKSPVDALRSIDASVAVVVADHRMPEMDGVELLARLRIQSPYTIRVLLTAVGDQIPLPALIDGAQLFRYVAKDSSGLDRLKIVLADAVEAFREAEKQKREFAELKALVRVQIGDERLFEDILGSDPRLQEAVKLGRRASKHKRPVLITGETGTGKDWLARAIHFESERRSGPFKAENCATYTGDLAQALLFGHEKNSYTGALEAKQGILREMKGGTVFLDEIGLLHSTVQGLLLRFLENGHIQPLGFSGKENLKAEDVRVIAATDRDFDAGAKKGEFMPALFHRLNGNHRIHLPPLRERRGDIPILAKRAMIVESSSRCLGSVLMSAAAMSHLQGLPYPGNIRDLNSTIVAAMDWMEDDRKNTIELEHVKAATQQQESTPGQPLHFREAVNEFKKRFIEAALKSHKYKSDAAKQLGMTPRNLLKLTKALGILTEE